MTTTPDLVTDWRIDVDANDEPILTGCRGGLAWRSLPVAHLDLDAGTARLVDGTVHRLGPPATAIDPLNPLALPLAAQERRLARLRAVLQRLARGEGPSADELASAPRLEGWTLHALGPYPILAGVVTGHPRLLDNEWIRTSPVVWLAEDRTAARTVSRWYNLGQSLEVAITRGGH